jgi:hypothetical protein
MNVDTSTQELQSIRTDTADSALQWLQAQFPDWEFRIARAAGWTDQDRQVWIASRQGHHDQSELSAAKLHTRLSDYLHREDQRQALMN